MSRDDNLRKSYSFLCEKEKTQQSFTIQELADATGWKESTIRTYLTKKWDKFIVKNEDDSLTAQGICDYTEEQYVRLMSQKQDISSTPKRPNLPSNVESLVLKAREAALHALDNYNRPATNFRTEGFIVMMVIAWTSLLHAIFEKQGKDYFYKNDDGTLKMVDGDKKAWELSQCVNQHYGDSNPPIRSNLEFAIGLRNRIEHRYAPAIDAHVGGECQALILNFDALLVREFGDYYALRDTLAVPLQTSNLRAGGQYEAMKQFQAQAYDDLKDYIDTFRSGLADNVYQDPHYSFRVYLIPKLGNHQSSSDLAYEFIKYDPDRPKDMEELEHLVTLIKDRQVPVANPGCYKPTQVAELVAAKVGRPFSVYNHTQAWKMYDVRRSVDEPEACNTKYCQLDAVHNDHIYTEEWVDFLVRKLSDEDEYRRLKSYKIR